MTVLTPRQREENRTLPYSEYLVSFEHKFVCCAIPKNGCTALKRWFLSVVDPDAPGTVDVHGHCRDFHVLCNQPRETIETVMREFFTFSVVRDPLKRIASAFAEKFVGPALHEVFEPAREVVEENERLHGATAPHDIIADIQFPGRTVTVPACSAIAYGRGVTFREFVKYLCESPDENLDAHWRPQSALLSGGWFKSIGRLDDLATYLPSIAERLGVAVPVMSDHTPAADMPAGGMFHGDMLSREMHRRGIYPSAATLYDEELRTAILDRYREDAELFNRVAIAT